MDGLWLHKRGVLLFHPVTVIGTEDRTWGLDQLPMYMISTHCIPLHLWFCMH